MQAKKETGIILILALAAALLTGCSDITTISLTENCSGSYAETVTISRSLWDMFNGASFDDQAVEELYHSRFPEADVEITDTVADSIPSKEIRLSMHFKDETEFRSLMDSSGLASVKFNQNYFSRSAVFIPASDSTGGDLLPDQLDDMLENDEQLLDTLMAEMQNINIRLTISFPYTVTDTNGSLQEDGRTVTWQFQQPDDGEERYYATFNGQTSTKAPSFSGAGNGKYYNTGVTLNVNAENLLKQFTENGTSTSCDYFSFTSEGSYLIHALDVNGNKNTIKFYIDMTKPVIRGVKNGQIYRKARKIYFSDAGSGIRKAVINNKKITSGQKISKAGSYTLQITDNAGNRKTVKFKIQ